MRQFLFGLLFLTFLSLGITAQPQSQEVSEEDGIPVIVKNLPDWESIRGKETLIKSREDLQKALGARPVFELIDFAGGTEAVTAPYEAGNLLIVEYNTPQFSIDADEKIKQRLAESGQNQPIFYRRIGNYNAFVFDGKDESSANALLDKINYGKVVQWLGEDPFLSEKVQRYKAKTMADVFLSTAVAVISGISLTLLLGASIGGLVFYLRKRQRESWEKFSDAGGMMRLNLDDLQETPQQKLLLKD